MTTRFEIVDLETNKVVHTVTSKAVGNSLDRVRNGMHMKVDFERFFIREVDEDEEAAES